MRPSPGRDLLTLLLLACAGCVHVPEYPAYALVGLERDVAVHTDPARIFPLHRVKLNEELIPVVYGLMVYDGAELEARRRSFPYARTFVNPGCEEAPAHRARVRFCPTCRQEAERWHARHPRSVPGELL